VDQRDLQGNILAGYGFDQSLFLVFRVTDPAAGRAALGELAEEVTTAVSFGQRRPPSTLNVAFTHDGLRALGMSDRALASFPDDFRHGMAARADRLGDNGPDAPRWWESGLRAGEPHVLVTVTAPERAGLDERRGAVKERAARPDSGIGLVHEQLAAVIQSEDGSVAREHFGFADGFAQPSIDGVAEHDPSRKLGPTARGGQGTPARGRWKDLAPGEFVLGYPDEASVVADQPEDPLRRSGSYMVLRKLRQDVTLFHRFLHEAAGGDADQAELLAAKIMGRWRDGTPVKLQPGLRPGVGTARAGAGAAGARSAPENDFRYGDDPHGMACPIGAHIRRANPRDAMGFGSRLTSRHRIIRRGVPYGPASKDPAVEDGFDRGLMFVCYQASIARQFEVVQGRWIADGDAFGLGADGDFVLGGEDPHGKIVIPGDPPRILGPRRSFVTNRGGGYFFAPGIAALHALAAGV
jgi:Dyp-type peroxidase family